LNLAITKKNTLAKNKFNQGIFLKYNFEFWSTENGENDTTRPFT